MFETKMLPTVPMPSASPGTKAMMAAGRPSTKHSSSLKRNSCRARSAAAFSLPGPRACPWMLSRSARWRAITTEKSTSCSRSTAVTARAPACTTKLRRARHAAKRPHHGRVVDHAQPAFFVHNRCTDAPYLLRRRKRSEGVVMQPPACNCDLNRRNSAGDGAFRGAGADLQRQTHRPCSWPLSDAVGQCTAQHSTSHRPPRLPLPDR
jgi:hypothetical protein